MNSTRLDVTLKTADSTTDNDEREGETATARLLQEVVIMRQFRHPNITRLHGVVHEDRVSRAEPHTGNFNRRIFICIRGSAPTMLISIL